MFNLCPENVSVKGYVTEKIYDAFCGGCIPIYYGGGGYKIEPDIINQERILSRDENNPGKLYEQIDELMKNEKYYNEFLRKPPLTDTAVDYLSDRNAKLIDKLREILHKKK